MASLVAAIQVQECLKLLDPGRWRGRTLGGRELSFNGSICEVEVSGLRAREDCYAHMSVSGAELLRMPGLSAFDTAGGVLRALAGLTGPALTQLYLGAAPGPGAMGGEIALERRCTCGRVAEICVLVGRLRPDQLPCECGRSEFLWESDLETTHIVSEASPQRLLDSRLVDLGIPRGGYVTARGPGGVVRVLELSADRVDSLFTPAVSPVASETPEFVTA
jgi:hypothetical protein